MKSLAIFALCITASGANANVWLMVHTSRTAIIDTVGTASAGVRGEGTAFAEINIKGDKVTTVREFRFDMFRFDKASILPDGTGVVGYGEQADSPTKMWIYGNPKKVFSEGRGTGLRGPAGCEVIDARFVNGKPQMLIVDPVGHYRVDQYDPDTGKITMLASDIPSNRAILGFPAVVMGPTMFDGAAKLLGHPIDGSWFKFFGGNGSSEKGSYDPVSNTLAVLGPVADGRVSILRATPNKALATLSIKQDVPITQILVSGGQTFVAKQGGKIAVFDESGTRLAVLNGQFVCPMN